MNQNWVREPLVLARFVEFAAETGVGFVFPGEGDKFGLETRWTKPIAHLFGY